MRRIKVGILNYSLFGGGAERNALNIASYFSKKKVTYDLIIFKDKNEFSQEYGKELHNLSIKSILPDKHISFMEKLFIVPYFLGILFAVLRKGNYSVLIGAVEYAPFYLAVLFSQLLGIKSILIIGNNIEQELLRRNPVVRFFYYLLFKYSLSHASHIVCVSQGLKMGMSSYFRISQKKMSTVYNGVQYTPLKKKRVLKKERVIVAFGRLVDKKGFNHLINSFGHVIKKYPDAKLQIIGKGELKEQLERQIDTLKLKKSVKLLGFIKQNPYKYLIRSDIFVFTSLYEGFGNVIIEAMNAGLPVISMDCPYGPHEILDGKPEYGYKRKEIVYGKWGILTPAISAYDSPHSRAEKERVLADAIINTLKDRGTYLKYQTASMERGKMFLSDKMSRQLLTLIQSLHNETKK